MIDNNQMYDIAKTGSLRRVADDAPHIHIPVDIREQLTQSQIDKLKALMLRQGAEHALAYRVSTQIGRTRIYFSMVAGIENRARSRIAREGLQRSPLRLAGTITLLIFMYAGVVVSVAAVAGLAIYAVSNTFAQHVLPVFP